MLTPSAQTIWLFDYDLTLYGFDESHVLDSLDANITAFVSAHLGIQEDAANRIRKTYWQKYGTTLGGLQALHRVAPHDFFDFIHGNGVLTPAADLRKRALLNNLPGTRYIFTNARRDWAERGVAAIGIADCFDGIFDLEYLNWIGKPAREPYLKVEEGLKQRGIQWDNPRHLVLLDDKPENLQTAHELGWTTVLVHPDAKKMAGPYDLCIAHLLDLPQELLL